MRTSLYAFHTEFFKDKSLKNITIVYCDRHPVDVFCKAKTLEAENRTRMSDFQRHLNFSFLFYKIFFVNFDKFIRLVGVKYGLSF